MEDLAEFVQGSAAHDRGLALKGGRRIIVCGGRSFRDAERVWTALDCLQVAAIAQGGANGADRLAREWALGKKIDLLTYHADWGNHGKAAGPLRNQRMLDEFSPDMVLAFPGGKGTADMVRRANAMKVIVLFP